MDPIVQFGKYKGKPLSTMLSDSQYLQWCKNKNILEKYPDIYNIVYCVNVVNTNQNDSPTPEHNLMQNKFLDKLFVVTFIRDILNIDKTIKNLQNDEMFLKNYMYVPHDINKLIKDASLKVTFEAKFNWDLLISLDYIGIDYVHVQKDAYKDIYEETREKVVTYFKQLIEERIKNKNAKKLVLKLTKDDNDDLNSFWNRIVQHPTKLVKGTISRVSKNGEVKYVVTYPDIDLKVECTYNDLNKLCVLKDYEYFYFQDELQCLSDFEKKIINTSRIRSYSSELNFDENSSNEDIDRLLSKIIKPCDTNLFKDLYNHDIDYHLKISNDISICCELKPTLGDDYPCVLRKMRQQIDMTVLNIKNVKVHCPFNRKIVSVLIVQNFEATSTTWQQLVDIFKQHNIRVMKMDNKKNPDLNDKVKYLETINKYLIDLLEKNDISYTIPSNLPEIAI